MKVLELFAGTRSIGKAFEQRGHEVFSVETVLSILRRRYHIDTMPVRGKIRTKHMFGFKIGALNFRKLLKYLSSREKYALNPETV